MCDDLATCTAIEFYVQPLAIAAFCVGVLMAASLGRTIAELIR